MNVTGTALDRSLEEAVPAGFWTDAAEAPEPHPPAPSTRADLAIVGGGLTGLWTAVLAKEQQPELDVVLLEANRIGAGGSGRSGGFLSESLTHGLAHGEQLWPAEQRSAIALGRRNLQDIDAFVRAERIEADLRWCGKTAVATEPHQVGELRDEADLHAEYGISARFLGAGGTRADIDSPTYRAGLRLPDSGGLVDPARLTWGLAAAAARRGVRLHETSRVRSLRSDRTGLRLRTAQGTVHARRAVLGTNAFPAPLRRLRKYVLPVWDYALVTEPLTAEQWASLGWRERQGVTDSHNRFHYYRPTPDGRILWGGYEAHYYFGGRTDAALARRWGPHRVLARNFFSTFPQLEGVRFTHRWGGPIDSTTRFTPLFGTACHGRIAYAVGYTGLGVAASRFGAQVALDLLAERNTEATELGMVTERPWPFPPEPLRWAVVKGTNRALAQADERRGHRGWWLRVLDRHGLGLGS